MLESKRPNRRAEVIPHSGFRGVEPHALRDDLGWGTVGAPDCERGLEADCGRRGGGGEAFVGGLVEGLYAFEVGRDVAAHVEALHGGRLCGIGGLGLFWSGLDV